ncbi:MAG TPA: D-alanine--D-alanine ligase family protein [Syntrophales bacterium]|nr:D-alanine--D-alanine ligase family protein [Syntrophales bacterium]HOL59697.1 D-alanine--D-alanine ligase family protein [Syntrophales bacterium]HPO35843.1 D-alanine--D-alanine ligase family protein [Syntrophales bacterium]
MEVADAKESKLRVGIIMGGLSSEKEVSLESGRNIFSKMDRRRFEPIPIFMDKKARLWEIPLKLLMRNSTSDIEEDLEAEAKPIHYESLKERVDLVFLGLHGKYGEDGCMQGLLELLHIPYTGSGVLASALGMNKYVARRLLSANGIDVPKSLIVLKKEWESKPEQVQSQIINEVGFPCVVKPVREGCSTAVKKVVNGSGIPAALAEVWNWDPAALVEEFIEGVEVTCGVLEDETPWALTPSETIPTEDILSLEDKFLYGKGENKTPARLPEATLENIKATALKAFSVLGIRGYARIDMFVRKDGRVAVLEANTLPGMTPSTVLFHQAAAHGLTQTDLISRIIDCAVKAHREKRGPL